MQLGKGPAVVKYYVSPCFLMRYANQNERHGDGGENRVRPRIFHEVRRLRQCPGRTVVVRGVAQLEIVGEVVTKMLEEASRNP